MEEAKLRKIVQDEIARQQATSRFNLKSIPFHLHDGVDSPRISEDNIALTRKLLSGLVVYDDGSGPIFSLTGVANVSHISFRGFAANNADGSAASKRALINGEVVFGSCYQPVGAGTIIDTNKNTGVVLPFMQGCNYVYLDSASGANTRVGFNGTVTIDSSAGAASPGTLAYAEDTNGLVASLSLISYKNATLTFETSFASNWKLQGILIIE